jgi:hypothetical protein
MNGIPRKIANEIRLLFSERGEGEQKKQEGEFAQGDIEILSQRGEVEIGGGGGS